MKDLLGNEIILGDVVVIAHRRGSSQWLEKRTVQGITPEGGIVLETGPRTHTRAGKKSKEYTSLYAYRGGSQRICVIQKKDNTVLPSFLDTTGIHSMVEGNRD